VSSECTHEVPHRYLLLSASEGLVTLQVQNFHGKSGCSIGLTSDNQLHRSETRFRVRTRCYGGRSVTYPLRQYIDIDIDITRTALRATIHRGGYGVYIYSPAGR